MACWYKPTLAWGIHVRQVLAPGSVLTADSVDEAVPLPWMAKGQVVAWCLNKEHRMADDIGKELRYSSTFVLVKLTCKPDPEKENSRLEFYSLYTGLAPLSAKVIKVNLLSVSPGGKWCKARYNNVKNKAIDSNVQHSEYLISGIKVFNLIQWRNIFLWAAHHWRIYSRRSGNFKSL
ncbi:hypothetical protein [Erwinia amylovora]|uniref:hypothetical protein n=1 Tax=Erwinia amylovora TaxID=552 RepID=UPI001F034DB6|nr:hypothetical protein [Erwinia amylovora]